jgi:sodium transport system permease protein
MRWSIIRLIWLRELRDQLRDRRTMFMMVVLPLLIYPLGGIALMQILQGASQPRSVIGIVGAEHLSNHAPDGFPPLLVKEGERTSFLPAYVNLPGIDLPLVLDVELLPPPDPTANGEGELARARLVLDQGTVDAVLVIPANFPKQVRTLKRPALRILSRADDRSRLAAAHLVRVLDLWKQVVTQDRFARNKLPADFDKPFEIDFPGSNLMRKPQEMIFDQLTQIFPFVLVLWSLAGALYPAVDLCAGEKERGTMETLLISPAQREELVWGKFLTIWVFSGVTALLNLLSMAVTSMYFSALLAPGSFNILSFAWCVVLLLPLSAFFSALCLAVGAYARSTKEGQYYLMPLFVITMPLIFLTLVPGVVLNPFYSMVPVTGVALLLQKLIQVGRPDPALWLYFVPVLVPMIIYSWLALRWAIIQFQREEVLFREAERLEIGLWLRRLLREREPRPSAGQALFCFVVVLGLSWFSLGLGSELLATNIIRFLAFVATPTVLMAFLLTTQPRQSLAVRVPPTWAWPVALALVVLLTPPLGELTMFLLRLNPNLQTLIEQYRPFTEWLRSLPQDDSGSGIRWWQALIVFAFLPAVCEELTFRGFILTGLQRRFRPRTAVLLSSFLFSLMHMNVFSVLPTFLLGVVLAYLTTRCGSILPSMLFHILYNSLLLAPAMFWPSRGEHFVLLGLEPHQRMVVAAVCTPLAAVLLWWLTWKRPHPAYTAFLQSDPGLEPPAT